MHRNSTAGARQTTQDGAALKDARRTKRERVPGVYLPAPLRSWQLPCDAPLHTFVLGAACLGLVLALTDFIADVFRDPMPPLTKQEQSAAKDERRRKLSLYTYVLMLILVWGSTLATAHRPKRRDLFVSLL